MNKEQVFTPADSYIRVATACPEVSIADVKTNTMRITELYNEAVADNVSVVTFPELSITGYTIGDLVQHTALLDQAEAGLIDLADGSENKQTAMVVGLPLRVNGGLFNCAAVVAYGKVVGIVPKSNLPTYNEFYEDRWYQTWEQENTTVGIGGEDVPFGTNILFDIGGVKCGIEICEDLWVGDQPSTALAKKGAQVILNPSASPEQIAKSSWRGKLVEVQSGRLISGYVYAGCDSSESTAEIVMGGHQLIAANGHIQAERVPFGEGQLLVTDIDLQHLEHDRLKQKIVSEIGALVLKTEVTRNQTEVYEKIERNPFLPEESATDRSERLKLVLQIQAFGLANRMKSSRIEKVTLGLSGGLDSTLALLVACEAAKILGKKPGDMIRTLTMPGMASSEQTQSNAQILAKALDVPNEVLPIDELALLELKTLGHDPDLQDVTYENVQARARTNLLFNYANQHGGMVLGTGDLSEILLGFCTYNADQQSHYNVNGSIPKTLVRHLVAYVAKQEEYKTSSATLLDILATPISPELTSRKDGEISQTTEDIIGPYELHDFFALHLLRWGEPSTKIVNLAKQAFGEDYSQDEISHWFGVFIRRFVQSQFKRENAPNAPKVASVSASPRGDMRLPPDLHNGAIWYDK